MVYSTSVTVGFISSEKEKFLLIRVSFTLLKANFEAQGSVPTAVVSDLHCGQVCAKIKVVVDGNLFRTFHELI